MMIGKSLLLKLYCTVPANRRSLFDFATDLSRLTWEKFWWCVRAINQRWKATNFQLGEANQFTHTHTHTTGRMFANGQNKSSTSAPSFLRESECAPK